MKRINHKKKIYRVFWLITGLMALLVGFNVVSVGYKAYQLDHVAHFQERGLQLYNAFKKVTLLQGISKEHGESALFREAKERKDAFLQTLDSFMASATAEEKASLTKIK